MIFEIISGGKKLTGWGKNGPAYFFPGEKTDWGEIPACYTGMGRLGNYFFKFLKFDTH